MPDEAPGDAGQPPEPRGGYGHGLAADIVSVKGENRLQRLASSEELWKWIDAHEKELGIGRPYLDRDPPHVGPIDGKEYADKRGRTKVQKAGLSTSNAPAVAASTTSRVNRASLKNASPKNASLKNAPPKNASLKKEPGSKAAQNKATQVDRILAR